MGKRTPEELCRAADAFIAQQEEHIIRDMAALVAVNSVEGEAAPGAPFGPGPKAALNAALAMAARMGFETKEAEGRVGWAILPGQTDSAIATVTHVDIVPAGDGWDADPFALRVQDGWLIGRGVLDDKGPAVLCLYAAKFLDETYAEEGRAPKHTLHTVLGTNEESGMGDLPAYLSAVGEPAFCFSPDADFPVCVGEKGLFSGDIVSGDLGGDAVITEFSGGLAGNVVPALARCTVQTGGKALANAPGIVVEAQSGTAIITATGKSAHAAKPEGGVNAIGVLVAYLLENGLAGEKERAFLELLNGILPRTDGGSLGIACRDEQFGPLTCIGGTIKMENGRMVQNINIRYPGATTGDALAEKIAQAAAKHGAALANSTDVPLFYQDPNSPEVQALLRAFEAATGEKGETFTIGGGTYARHFKNAVSFGPHFPAHKNPPFAGAEHMANEGASLADMKTALKVYILALYELLDI